MLSTIRNGHPAAPGGLQRSRLSVQHGRSASFASSLAALPASLGSSAAIAATGCAASFALIGLTSRCFAHWARASCAPRHCHPQFAMVVSASCAKRTSGPPLLIGLTTACFATGGGLRAPPPVSAEILWISGRGNCKEAIFALENGIFRRKNRPAPAVHAAGDD